MSKEPPCVQVFRLRTSAFHSPSQGLVVTKSLRRLKRQSSGFEWLEEDISNIGADLVVGNIQNLFTVPDGIYSMELCNVSYEYVEGYRTGNIDDYDYELKPFTKTQP